MSVNLIGNEEIYFRIYRKLIRDWVIVIGDTKAIRVLVETIYAPNTPGNKDINALLLPRNVLFIGRKRQELSDLLNLKCDPKEWNSLFMLVMYPMVDGRLTGEARHIKSGVDRERYLEGFLRSLLESMGVVFEKEAKE
jgi:hypothetical protein